MRPSSSRSRRDQVRQHHRRVGRPVAVVAAVQGSHRAVEGELQARHPAGAEVDLHPPGGMDRAVAEDPGVGSEQIRVLAQDLREVGRALLLLALQEELEVNRGWTPRGAQGIERRQHGHDRRLVVARRAGVEPPLRIERPGDRGRDPHPSPRDRAVPSAAWA